MKDEELCLLSNFPTQGSNLDLPTCRQILYHLSHQESYSSYKEGSGWGTHVYLWQIHFDIWQN